MSAVKKNCDICVGEQIIISPTEADFYSNLNGINICSHHLEHFAYEIFDDRQPLRYCSTYILGHGRKRCKLVARQRIIGSDGVAVCGKHVCCLCHTRSNTTLI